MGKVNEWVKFYTRFVNAIVHIHHKLNIIHIYICRPWIRIYALNWNYNCFYGLCLCVRLYTCLYGFISTEWNAYIQCSFGWVGLNIIIFHIYISNPYWYGFSWNNFLSHHWWCTFETSKPIALFVYKIKYKICTEHKMQLYKELYVWDCAYRLFAYLNLPHILCYLQYFSNMCASITWSVQGWIALHSHTRAAFHSYLSVTKLC